MDTKVQKLLARLAEVEELLGNPEIFSDQKKYRTLTQEHSYLSEIRNIWDELQLLNKQTRDNKNLLKEETDPEFARVLHEDNELMEKRIHELQLELENLLVPPDPNDSRNTILELRAGTGGEEAALFVSDCARMYNLFADRQGWKSELLSCAPSDLGGYKEYILVLSGPNVHRLLKYEAGTHRVQRVPATEAQGRVHTSAITIAILMEPTEQEDFQVDEKDLRIDTMRASGAGGQHVQKTDSAVRITHIPSGLVVVCQEERSQIRNREKAFRLLKAKLIEMEEKKQHEAIASTRAMQVGTGDRSERIRTYNFPQNRVTDHRIDLTLYNLDQVMEGDLEEIVTSLVKHFHQEALKE
jgi:peptide chain release factor 1